MPAANAQRPLVRELSICWPRRGVTHVTTADAAGDKLGAVDSPPVLPPLLATPRRVTVYAMWIYGILLLVLIPLLAGLLLLTAVFVVLGLRAVDQPAAAAVGYGVGTLDVLVTVVVAVLLGFLAGGFLRHASRLDHTRLIIDGHGIRATEAADPVPWQHIRRLVIIRSPTGQRLIVDDGAGRSEPPRTFGRSFVDWTLGRRYGLLDVPIEPLDVPATTIAVAIRDHSQGRFPSTS